MQEKESYVQVVHAFDPHLFVANMTSGSMILANTNVNEVAFGAVAIVLAVVLASPLLLTLLIGACQRLPALWRDKGGKGAPYKESRSLDVHVALSDDMEPLPEV